MKGKRDPIALSLVEPESVEIEIETDSGDKRAVHLRPFSLRDEKWLNTNFDDADLSKALLEDNDLCDLIKVFVHQLHNSDRAWLATQYEVSEDDLAQALYERLPADRNADPNPAVAIIAAVFRARSSSYPELLESELKKKIRPSIFFLLMKWSLPFVAGWAAAWLTLT